MIKSEQLGELFAALAKAQGEIKAALKSSTVTVTKAGAKAHYADLSSIWDACRASLSANGLSVLQPATADGLTVTVTTVLGHSSGQYVAESLAALADSESTKSIGAAITSLRRMALAPMVGVAMEDDPELAASEAVAGEAARLAEEARARKLAERLAAKGGATPPAPGVECDAFPRGTPASYARLAELRQAMFDRVKPDDEDAAWKSILAKRGVTSAKDLDLAGLEELTSSIERRIAEFDEEAHKSASPDGLPAPSDKVIYGKTA